MVKTISDVLQLKGYDTRKAYLSKPVDFQQFLASLALLTDEESVMMADGKQLDSGEI